MALGYLLPPPTGLAILALVAFAALFWLYRAALPKPIPGIAYHKPSARRILGDIPDMVKSIAKTQDIMDFMLSRCLELDSPIVQIFAMPFSKPWVLLCDARETVDITTRRSREFDRSNFVIDIFHEILPHFQITLKTGDEWRSNRRLMADCMNPKFLNKVARAQIYSTTLDLVDLWREKIRLAQDHAFEAQSDLHKSTLDAIWASTFGSAIGGTPSATQHLSQLENIDLPKQRDEPASFPAVPTPPDFNDMVALMDSCQIPVNVPIFPRLAHRLALNFNRTLSGAVKRNNRLINHRLDAAWEKFSQTQSNDDDVKCATDLIVQREVLMAQKERRTPQHKSPSVQNELKGFIFAGHETTATTVTWGLKFLTESQESQTKLLAALRAAFPRAAEAGDNPTADEIINTSIPYLDASIEEVLRVACAAPGIARTTMENTELLGHRIPKGTEIFMLLNGPSYNMAPLYIDDSKRSATSQQSKDMVSPWKNADVGMFKPERWLVKNEKGETEFDQRAGPENSFGGGPRGCFGKRLAYLKLRVIFALVFWNFHLKPVPDQLAGRASKTGATRQPQQCYIRLAEVQKCAKA